MEKSICSIVVEAQPLTAERFDYYAAVAASGASVSGVALFVSWLIEERGEVRRGDDCQFVHWDAVGQGGEKEEEREEEEEGGEGVGCPPVGFWKWAHGGAGEWGVVRGYWRAESRGVDIFTNDDGFQSADRSRSRERKSWKEVVSTAMR